MILWYESLDTFQCVFAYIAIPSTVLLILQTILLLFGVGKGDADSDGSLVLFSVRNIAAMLSICGWSGIAMIELNLNIMIAVILSVFIGLFTLFGMTLFIKVLR